MRISPSSQKGSTLIIVLVLLLVITILGTLAVRQGLVSLSISTNSQAQTLLMQSSDSVFYTLEDPVKLARYIAGDSILGYIRMPANRDKELVFCYRNDQTSFFDMDKASVIYWPASGTTPTNNDLGTDGYCDPDVAGSFTSGRKAVLTQINVKIGTSTLKPFAGIQRGTEAETAKIDKAENIIIYATSVVPGLSTADPEDIQSCLSEHMSKVKIPAGATPATDADDTITDCLTKLNVPFSTQVSEYRLEQAFAS